MNSKLNFVFLILILIEELQFGAAKKNYISKCYFENGDRHVNYECEDSDEFIENSDLSCCTLGCYYEIYENYTPKSVSLKFNNCKVSQLGIDIFGTYSLIELNLSNMDLETLQPKDFHLATELQTLDASHNFLTKLPAGLFINASKLKRVDFSNNRIDYIDKETFRTSSDDDISSNIETINLSHNKITSIGNQPFANLSALIELNLEHNLIETLDTAVFTENPNLQWVRFDGNKLKEFICSGYFIIYEINLSFNCFEKFNASCITEANESLQINVAKYGNQEFPLITGQDGLSNTGKFTNDDLSETKLLNVSNSQIDNIHGIIGRLSEPLTVLDVSGNILQTLSVDTFARLINLETLVLRNTKLTTIQYGLFHHQKQLRWLDISYNNLKKIQFETFGRNLGNLESLFLDGNNLNEIDGLRKKIFPKVHVLGISNNNFSCKYLVNFLEQWDGVELIKDELSNRSHVERITCDEHFIDHIVQGGITTASTSSTLKMDEPSLVGIWQLLILACAILCVILIMFVVKIFTSMCLKRKWMQMNRNESNVTFKPGRRRGTVMKMHKADED